MGKYMVYASLFAVLGVTTSLAYNAGVHVHDKLLNEIVDNVSRSAYSDQACTIEIPLTEIYSDSEMDLWRRTAIAIGRRNEWCDFPPY